MTRDGHAVGARTVHVCETVPAMRSTETLVLHVVLPPRCPGQTPLADLRDAGYRVVSYGVFPEEIPECADADAHPGCEHVLVARVDAP